MAVPKRRTSTARKKQEAFKRLENERAHTCKVL